MEKWAVKTGTNLKINVRLMENQSVSTADLIVEVGKPN